MSCPDLATLERHVRVELDAAMERELLAHLVDCASCRTRLEGIRANLDEARFLGAVRRERSGSSAPTQELGPYRVSREIGRGGMGIVYAAVDTRLDRPVALKLLHRSLARSAYRQRRFRLEARLLAALDDPRIVSIYALEELDDTLVIAMELVDGTDLRRRLEEGPIPVDEAIRVALDVARALATAHERGVIHQDLKPANVVLSGGGRAKVLDFGLARAFSPRVTGRATAREVGGTPGYMSPEQTRGAPAGPATDVWALGCLLFECLTGAPAIPGRTPAERVAATRARAIDLGALPDEIPGALATLISAMLSPTSSRPGDVRPIVSRLEEVLDEIAVTGPEPGDVPGNLPAPIDAFVGRHAEVLAVRRALRRARLITLRGSGGSGKTRLAIEVARSIGDRHPGGTWLADLAPLHHGDAILPELARALGVSDPGRGASLLDVIVGRLTRRPALLVVDNCEHLVADTASVAAELLARCPDIRVLATSREHLGVPGEALVDIAPLPLADDDSDPGVDPGGWSDAARLFRTRAMAVAPELRPAREEAITIGRICRRLDGIPLAIELAAAQLRTETLDGLALHLDDRLEGLTGASRDPLPHHRTLRACIDWSHDRLTANEQELLHALSICEGGTTLELARALVPHQGTDEVARGIRGLVEKSLLRRRRGGGDDRVEMLDTVREYARERLVASGREPHVVSGHRGHLIALATGSDEALVGPDQRRWLERLDAEHANLRTAIDLAIERGATGDALRLAGSLGRYWQNRGHWATARAIYARVRTMPGADVDTPELALVLNWAGCFAATHGEYREACALLERSDRISAGQGDLPGVARAQNGLGGVALVQGDVVAAHRHYRRALEIQRGRGHDWGVSACLNNLGLLATHHPDLGDTEQLLSESLEIRRRLGDHRGMAMALNNLGRYSRERGDHDAARRFYEEALDLHRQAGDPPLTATVLTNLGEVALDAGDTAGAMAHFQEGLAIRRQLGDRWEESNSLDRLGDLARGLGHPNAARDAYLQSLAIRVGVGHARSTAISLERCAALDAETGDARRAARLFGAAERANEGASRRPSSGGFPVPEGLESVAAILGARAFDSERSAGRSLSTAEALALALGEHDPSSFPGSGHDTRG